MSRRLDQVRAVDPRTALWLVLLAVPMVAYLLLVRHFAVNVVFADQWSDVQLLAHHYDGSLSLSNLWSQHNENRILIPNLLVLFLAAATHLDIATECLLSALLLVGSSVLVIYGHHRRSRNLPFWVYLPVVLLMLSSVQQENALWGFQIAWYMVLFFVVASLVLLDGPHLDAKTTVAAIVCAIIASYSSVQGLLVWPAALFLIYHRKRPIAYWIAWITAAAVVAAIYLYNYSFSAYGSFARTHPVQSLKFYFYAVGQIFGVSQALGQGANLLVLSAGVVLVAAAVATIVLLGLRRDTESSAPFGIAIALVGLGFTAIITQGRDIFGYWAASASRYTTMDLLIPVGTYLALIGYLAHARARAGQDASVPSSPSGSEAPAVTSPVRRHLVQALVLVVVPLALAQIIIGNGNGWSHMEKRHAHDVVAQQVLRNIRTAPDAEIPYLDPFGEQRMIRRLAPVLERHHLTAFAP